MKEVDQSVLWHIWTRIVSELASHQDSAPKEFSGQIVNPICGAVYILDTACAAKAFAVEYLRTNKDEWNARARAALESIPIYELFSGIHEPIWDAHGWHEEPASLAATGIAVDAFWDSLDLLRIDLKEKDYELILAFLATCFHGKGKFAHNAVRQGQYTRDVQNTNAVALYLLEHIFQKVRQLKHPLLKERERVIYHLQGGQKKSGFWPYIYPGWRGKFSFASPLLKKIPELQRYLLNANSGDIMHHAMTLYFVVKYFISSKSREQLKVVLRGWEWLKRQLINCEEETLAIDWSCEPVPVGPIYCNLGDTNTYFWILGFLPHLENLRIINRKESATITESLLKYIFDNLLEEERKIPCIIPHEGPLKILRNILPVIDQGVAWKGNFLAEIVKRRL